MQTTKKVLRSPQPFITYIVLIPVLLLTFAWLLNTPAGLLGKADAIGYAVCHRIDLRSFHLGDRQLPLCARCSGMYLGAMIGLLWQAFFSPRRMGSPPKRVIFVLGVFLFAFAVDGINSFVSLFPGGLQLYAPSNPLRLLTGTGMGLVIAAALFPAYNASVWQQADARPAIDGLKRLGVIILLAIIVDIFMLTENPMLLYPLAIISAAGVLILLTLVYTMLWLVVLKYENRYNGLKDLIVPLIAGFGLALVQIGILDWLRFLLTGTWDGFHLG
jgi:uncharacterized membrane protein